MEVSATVPRGSSAALTVSFQPRTTPPVAQDDGPAGGPPRAVIFRRHCCLRNYGEVRTTTWVNPRYATAKKRAAHSASTTALFTPAAALVRRRHAAVWRTTPLPISQPVKDSRRDLALEAPPQVRVSPPQLRHAACGEAEAAGHPRGALPRCKGGDDAAVPTGEGSEPSGKVDAEGGDVGDAGPAVGDGHLPPLGGVRVQRLDWAGLEAVAGLGGGGQGIVCQILPAPTCLPLRTKWTANLASVPGRPACSRPLAASNW